jgi:hypothetical protein
VVLAFYRVVVFGQVSGHVSILAHPGESDRIRPLPRKRISKGLAIRRASPRTRDTGRENRCRVTEPD